MRLQRSLAEKPVDVGVERDIQLSVEPAIVGSRCKRMQMFPALWRGRMSLIVWEVFVQVPVDAHDGTAKTHRIQKADLLIVQSIARVVIGLWGLARTQGQVPASPRRIPAPHQR